jgi:geranylgeranyl diphosphate synthase, type II
MVASSYGRWIFSIASPRFDLEREAVERSLDAICQTRLAAFPQTVAAAMSYGLKSPGKRLRPIMTILAYEACGGESDIMLLACGPEIIHAYSLIHDDLPCMDDDEIRRGRPTVHKVYGARAAIVAGLAMIPLAAAVVRDGCDQIHATTATHINILRTLLSAAGDTGMIGGQAMDLAGEGLALPLEERERIHSAKTAALIAASLQIGGLAAEASAEDTEALAQFGRDIGLAFQIMDDVLDVTSTPGVLGKTTGRDAELGKSSYPALLGVEGARKRAEALVADGSAALARRDLLTPGLSQVANFMLTRNS